MKQSVIEVSHSLTLSLIFYLLSLIFYHTLNSTLFKYIVPKQNTPKKEVQNAWIVEYIRSMSEEKVSATLIVLLFKCE